MSAERTTLSQQQVDEAYQWILSRFPKERIFPDPAALYATMIEVAAERGSGSITAMGEAVIALLDEYPGAARLQVDADPLSFSMTLFPGKPVSYDAVDQFLDARFGEQLDGILTILVGTHRADAI